MKTIFVDAVVCEIVYRRCQWRTPRHGDFCVLRTLSKIVRSSNAQRNNFWKSTLLNEFTQNSASLIVYSSRVLHNYRIVTAACVCVWLWLWLSSSNLSIINDYHFQHEKSVFAYYIRNFAAMCVKLFMKSLINCVRCGPSETLFPLMKLSGEKSADLGNSNITARINKIFEEKMDQFIQLIR